MFQKIANILSIASFLLITSTLGASYFGYKYLTSPQFQNKIMNMVLSDVQKLMPKMLDKNIMTEKIKKLLITRNSPLIK